MITKLASTLVIVIIAVLVILIIHPVTSANAAISTICKANSEMYHMAQNNTSTLISIILMQIIDSHNDTDPKYAAMELKLANQSLGALISGPKILDNSALSKTIDNLINARDLMNNNTPTKAVAAIKKANIAIHTEVSDCFA
jgi:hypothetical protein